MSPAIGPSPPVPMPVLTTSLDSPMAFPITPPPAEEDNHAETIEAAGLTREIFTIYAKLLEFPDASPNPELNGLFTRLVRLCIEPRTSKTVDTILANDQIKVLMPHLRALCSEGEAALESFWAKEILSVVPAVKEKVRERLRDFPYYNNYVELCRLESSVIRGVLTTTPRCFAFIGSGPLPLTSFCLADCFPSAHIHNIDRDAEAIRLSSALSHRLGYCGRVKFAHESAVGSSNMRRFDVVFLAALVGSNPEEKRGILADLARRMRDGALICVRSAHSLRQLLYPVVDVTDDLQSIGLEVVVVVHPWGEIVNSLVVMKVAHREGQ